MSKKQIAILLIVCSLIFLLTNLQYLPGPRFMYLPVIITPVVMSCLLVIWLLICMPTLLILPVVDWLRKRREPTYKMQWGVIATCLILSYVACASMYAGEFGFKHISGELAIKKANPLIAAIGHYKQVHHSYPASINIKDYSTGIMGIDRYYYDTVANGYRISFKQWGLLCMDKNWTAYEPHTTPVVMGYNGNFPTSHKYWYSYTRFN